MVYGSETWALRKEDESVLQRAERAMVRIICGVKLRERKISTELLAMLGLEYGVLAVAKKSRLRWYGHVQRRTPEVAGSCIRIISGLGEAKIFIHFRRRRRVTRFHKKFTAYVVEAESFKNLHEEYKLYVIFEWPRPAQHRRIGPTLKAF